MNKIITKAPIIGFVRYSQKIKFGDRERDMFEPEYFEYRFNIFKNVTLKSFQQQTNSNFVLLLLHSENMPTQYKQRFHELEKENSFLYNVFVKDTQESFEEAIRNSFEYVTYEKGAAVTFRIDNDDAVQKNFIQKLNDLLKNEFVDYCISIPNMIIVKRIDEQHYMVQESYYPANSIGLAYVTCKENYKTIMDLGQHHLMNDENSMILLGKLSNGGLMTINGENAINSIDETRSVILSKDDLEKYLVIHNIENLDLDCLGIFHEESYFSKISFKRIIGLLMPPVITLIIRRVKNF